MKINKIYDFLLYLLEEKSKITRGEVRNLKYSIKYIKEKNLLIDDNKESQFIRDCEIIKDGLINLEIKVEENIKDLEQVQERLHYKDIESLEYSNKHLTDILLLDCFQNREFSFSKKLEYLHHSFENLISPYQTMYLPLPTSYRRVRSSTLMLFFNKTINQKVEILAESFYEIKSRYKVFSTWNFSDYDHVKNLDNSNNIYLSLSFWFYEKQLFYPIAFHEISHSLFYDSELKLSYKDRSYIKKYIDIKEKNSDHQFIRNQLFIEKIYQDIIADFSAFSLSGSSYIFSLFFHGFAQGLFKNFYQDLEIQNIDKKINDKDRKCLKREEDLTLLDWAFDTKGQNFVSYFIRLKLLIELSKRLNGQYRTYSIFKDEIDAIESILNLIYPPPNQIEQKKENINTFETILKSYYKVDRQYQYWKNYTFVLENIFKKIVFYKKHININVSRTLSKTKNEFDDNKIFQNILKNKEEIENFNSPFDLYWYKFFKGQKNLGRLLRLYNITSLGLEPKIKDIDNVIFEIVFFKFASKKNPYIQFYENEDLIFSSKNFEEIKLKYAFGPFDFAIISKKTTLEVDEDIEKFSKTHNFFIERHALFLLEQIYGNNQSSDIFDIFISIDIKSELNKDVTKSFYENIIKILNDFKIKNKKYFDTIRLFASLGNENFLLYIKNISIENFNKFVEQISKINEIKNLHTTIMLNENFALKNSDFKNSKDREIIVLGKLKLDYNLEQLKKKLKCKNVSIYRKYGVFDFLIKFSNDENVFKQIYIVLKAINDYVLDIQLEFQNSDFN